MTRLLRFGVEALQRWDATIDGDLIASAVLSPAMLDEMIRILQPMIDKPFDLLGYALMGVAIALLILPPRLDPNIRWKERLEGWK